MIAVLSAVGWRSAAGQQPVAAPTAAAYGPAMAFPTSSTAAPPYVISQPNAPVPATLPTAPAFSTAPVTAPTISPPNLNPWSYSAAPAIAPAPMVPGAPAIPASPMAPAEFVPRPPLNSPQASTLSPPAPPTVVEEPVRGVWRFLPVGIVPHFGPRTPESRRHTGYGEALVDTSWRTQPLYVGVFGGGLDGGPFVPDRFDQDATLYGGIVYGWDYDHRWGFSRRLGYEALNLHDDSGGPDRHGWAVVGEERLLFYPWGDMRWRPYFMGGLGLGEWSFTNDHDHRELRTLFVGSFGFGLKYMIVERLAISGEVSDLLVAGQRNIASSSNLIFVGGIEFRFGQRFKRE